MRAAAVAAVILGLFLALFSLGGCATKFADYNPLGGPAPADMAEEQCAEEHHQGAEQSGERPTEPAIKRIACPGIPDVSGLVPVLEEIMPNGLMYRAYDLNNDGKIDHAQAHVVNMTFKEGEGNKFDVQQYPLFYEVDDNGDGAPDRVMVDKLGTGKCEDIVLYIDLTVPHENRGRGDAAGI
jgi:hypothetical protein